jgi:monomeric sarcosine oxidase
MHQLAVENLTAAEVHQRFPGFVVPAGSEAVFEPHAGFLRVEDCIRAQVGVARQYGARVRFDTIVRQIEVRPDQIRVRTSTDSLYPRRLVVCAGAWAKRWLTSWRIPLRVLRKHLHWFAVDDPHLAAARGCPTFLCERPQGFFYGFPAVDGAGVKVAEHSGGEELSDPDWLDPRLDPVDAGRVEDFVRSCLPTVRLQRLRHDVCMYTMTPDEHFVVAQHPDQPQVVAAAGLSGHGFKFAAVLGEILTELALDGSTRHPVGFLCAERFLQA